ncbi:MAG: rRNA pseudouridine synthase [Oscillospiraceae bacterium]|nr:rRNA pseudouridine synthase [Oscillospiraceae bacterium]
MRLDRFLSGQTAGSRRDAVQAIRHGAVAVNGIAVRDPAKHIDPETDAVTMQGKEIRYETQRYFLMHKPAGVITASRDSKQKTVLDLLKPEDHFPDIAPVGRLDMDTAGLLLLTDDGKLAHRLISPAHHIPKYYMVWLRDPFAEAVIPQFRAGIFLREGDSEEQCLPAECVKLDDRIALLELREGKYHQVKRMFAAAGNHVEHLLRVQFGGLFLPPDLPKNAYTQIFQKEINILCGDSSIFEIAPKCMYNYSSYWINETE